MFSRSLNYTFATCLVILTELYFRFEIKLLVGPKLNPEMTLPGWVEAHVKKWQCFIFGDFSLTKKKNFCCKRFFFGISIQKRPQRYATR